MARCQSEYCGFPRIDGAERCQNKLEHQKTEYMKRYLIRIGMTALFATFAFTSWAQSRDNQDEVVKLDANNAAFDFVPGQVLVKFKDASPVQVQNVKGKFKAASIDKVSTLLTTFGVDEMEKLLPSEVAGRNLRRAKAFNGEEVKEADLSQLYFIKTKSLRPDSTMLLVKELKALNEVEFAEPNYRVYALGNYEAPQPEGRQMETATEVGTTEEETTADTICTHPSENPLYSQQWGIHAVGLDSLWTKPIVNKRRPVIAILDTGVQIDHPDLAPNIWTNSKESAGTEGYDDDNNGFKDDVHGWDFINNTADIHDWNSHGTHVAGIAAAADNEQGVIGANPLAIIMPVTVMQSDGTGDIATIVKGINYAVNNGATVLNMSFGTYGNSLALRTALANAYQKAVLVAAAGNDGLPMYIECNPYRYGTMYPAAYSFVLGVQATAQNSSLQYGYRASWSNYDCDGPVYSAEKDAFGDDGMNYELSAPGASIISSVIGGNYKIYNGTSMAAPLVAGGISALKMVRTYDSKEVLWGDLINLSDATTGNVNFNNPTNLTSRPAELDLTSIAYVDSLDGGNGDGMPDAGETMRLYPTIRTTWGDATNIKMNLSVAEGDDSTLVSIQNRDVDFGWHLTSYAHQVSKNPIIIKISDKVADARHIRLLLTATCDNSSQGLSYEFPIVVNNIVKIGGILTKNMTLTADKHYLVSTNLGIPEGDTLTIEPGTIVKSNYATISSTGKLIIKGTPEKPINFYRIKFAFTNGDTLKFCKFEYPNYTITPPKMEDCVIKYAGFDYKESEMSGIRNNFYYNSYNYVLCAKYKDTNIINNLLSSTQEIDPSGHSHCNIFNNIAVNPHNNNSAIGPVLMGLLYAFPKTIKLDEWPYIGTSTEKNMRRCIYELGSDNQTFAWYDLSNKCTRPYKEAHGIVWKVVVNGYDAQDEYDSIAPLGVGKHKFEVYFNRPMNVKVAPNISMGVREPYSQVPITEDGAWSADSTVYTAYCTITGKTASDGINRIYVNGAEDNEYFEIPYEKTRFNVNVQAAGSLATGFTATAGLGKVDLNWNNEHNDITDAIGYNVYRYTMVNDSTTSDTIQINDIIVDVDSVHYTDYNVVPGKTYYYLYRTLSSALKEYDVSNVVAVTPITATKGDANGSMAVDISDVVTAVNYAIGNNPKPFIFDAADVNNDKSIDILDVIGIINIVLNQSSGAKSLAIESTATYSVENGVLYVESPVALSGVQVKLNVPEGSQITATDELADFEQSSTWLDKNEYMLLAYNMNGRQIAAGKHALLHIGNATVDNLLLSDRRGASILAINGNATGLETTEALQFEHPYPNPFSTQLTIPYLIGKEGQNRVEINFFDLAGRMVDKYTTTVNGIGKYSYTWIPKHALTNGLYFVTLRVNGTDAQTVKVLYEK
jgi:hypothetical protein